MRPIRGTRSPLTHTPPLSSYIGLPELLHGDTRGGVDCWGLACLFYREQYQILLPTYNSYESLEDGAEIAECVELESQRWAEVKSPGPGDLLLFRLLGHPCHVGIYLEADRFLHVLGHPVNMERLTDTGYGRRLEAAYRHASRSGSSATCSPPE